MSAVATKRHMNWSGVTFTPTAGVPVVFSGVLSVQINPGGSLLKFSGDGDRYNTTVVNDFNDPSIVVECADAAAVASCFTGQVGVFTATHNDAKNVAGTGAITYTFNGATVDKLSSGGAHKQFGKSSISFVCSSADGVTNPIVTSIAP